MLQKELNKKSIYSSLPMQVFLIHAIKKPLLNIFTGGKPLSDEDEQAFHKLLDLLENKIPEPSKENTWNPNSHNWMELRDKFDRCCKIGGQRQKLVRQFFNLIIILLNMDPPWALMLDSVFEWAREMHWEPKEFGFEDRPKYPWWDYEEAAKKI